MGFRDSGSRLGLCDLDVLGQNLDRDPPTSNDAQIPCPGV